MQSRNLDGRGAHAGPVSVATSGSRVTVNNIDMIFLQVAAQFEDIFIARKQTSGIEGDLQGGAGKIQMKLIRDRKDRVPILNLHFNEFMRMHFRAGELSLRQ